MICPAWANSLFEDFCEFGLGMTIANEKMRARLDNDVRALLDCPNCSDDRSGFRGLTAGVGVYFGVEYEDVDIFA